jgi:hypothetical protein
LISRAWTYDHGQAVREGDEVGTADAGALAVEVAGALGAGAGDGSLGALLLMVLETERPGVLADNLDVLPAQAGEALSGDLAEGRGEVDEVDAGEELRDGDEFGHGLDVPAGTATDLGGVSL